jgi:hypothetical protein
MTIGTANIKMSQIQTEFGGSNPIRMSEYYAGGDNVNSTQPNVPSSGLIEISDFSGAQNTAQFSATLLWIETYGIRFWRYLFNSGGADSGSISPQRCLLRNKWEGDDGSVATRNHPSEFRLWYTNSGTNFIIYTPTAQKGNSGWTSIIFTGKAGGSTTYAQTYNRSAATYSEGSTSNGYTLETWTWNTGSSTWGGTGVDWTGTIQVKK